MVNTIDGVDAYPLTWPDGWPRTPPGRRQRGRFRPGGFGRQRDEVLAELRRMGARQVVLSTNVPLRQDGLPYANRRAPEDPGVAVYWRTRDGDERSIACDRWDRLEDNARAIALTLDALRGIERWGSSDIVERAFRGFAALPPPSPSEKTWREVLGFPPLTTPSLSMVRGAYYHLSREAHPDAGGNHERMVALNNAMRAAEKELG